MENIVEPLEKVAGRKLDMDEFKHAVGLSRECSDLWDKCLAAAAAIPSPLTFFDGTTLMGPAVVGRGTQKAIDAYIFFWKNSKNGSVKSLGAMEEERSASTGTACRCGDD